MALALVGVQGPHDVHQLRPRQLPAMCSEMSRAVTALQPGQGLLSCRVHGAARKGGLLRSCLYSSGKGGAFSVVKRMDSQAGLPGGSSPGRTTVEPCASACVTSLLFVPVSSVRPGWCTDSARGCGGSLRLKHVNCLKTAWSVTHTEVCCRCGEASRAGFLLEL